MRLDKLWRDVAFKSSNSFFCENNLKPHLNIQRIKNGNPIVMWAHQPNILSSISVLSSAIELVKYARKVGAVPVFVVMDYDESGDQRFRSPCLPAQKNSKDSKYFLNGAVAKSNRKKLANSLVISNSVLDSWNIKYTSNLLYWQKYLSIENTKILEKDVIFHFRNRIITKAATLQILDDLRWLGFDGVIPVFASEVWNDLYSHMPFLELQNQLINSDKLLWWICPNCLERKQCHILNSQISAKCLKCVQSIKKNLSDITPESFIPRHALCNLIDILGCSPKRFFLYYRTCYHFEESCVLAKKLFKVEPSHRVYCSLNDFVPSVRSDLSNITFSGNFSQNFFRDLFLDMRNQYINCIEKNIKSFVK